MYPNATSFTDRHGKTRWRFRRKKVSISLPGQPGEEDFQRAYEQACRGRRLRRSVEPKVENHKTSLLRREAMAEHYSDGAVKRARKRAKRLEVPFAISTADFKSLM